MDYTTNSLQLEEMARQLDLPLLGVVSKDELEGRVKVGSIILNLQSSMDGGGTHWTLLKVFPKGVIYFDPFGFAPPRQVRRYIGKKMGSSTRQIQDQKSTMCGYYCLMADHYMTHSKQDRDIYERFDDFLNLFKVDTKQNDQLVKDYLRSKGIVI